jgi:hypothetical protein
MLDVAASLPDECLGVELALQLHRAPDLGAVCAQVGLDLGGQLADAGQVDAEQLRALRKRRGDRAGEVGRFQVGTARL